MVKSFQLLLLEMKKLDMINQIQGIFILSEGKDKCSKFTTDEMKKLNRVLNVRKNYET